MRGEGRGARDERSCEAPLNGLKPLNLFMKRCENLCPGIACNETGGGAIVSPHKARSVDGGSFPRQTSFSILNPLLFVVIPSPLIPHPSPLLPLTCNARSTRVGFQNVNLRFIAVRPYNRKLNIHQPNYLQCQR